MKVILVFLSLLVFLFASDNNESNTSKDINVTKVMDKNITKNKVLEENLKKQMKNEQKYAKEQKFYTGKEYNLKEKEVNEKSLSHIKAIEPDYDFDITDVYADDQ